MPEDAGVEGLQDVVARLGGDDVVAVLEEAAQIGLWAQQVQLVASGVIATRSSREAGHSGLAQSRGHRTPAALVQEITGTTKGEAARVVRVGTDLIAPAPVPDAAATANDTPGATPDVAWWEPLRGALHANTISSAAYDAIRRGLGEPPEAGEELSDEARTGFAESSREAWRQAAEQLVGEASERTVEELAQAARTVRDLLDPEGAEARFLARFEKRSFRRWKDADGLNRASLILDDEGAAFLDSVENAALRPRRGGPRFVDPEEKRDADALVEDARTNDQLSYDLFMDILRAGVLADPAAVYGTRQAGVRLVQVIDPMGSPFPVGHTEDGLTALPAAAIDQNICNTGTVDVTIDACGNPLDVGREQRLFTSRQRIGLAIRDGGCRWKGCDLPASYCEAHHIDEWDRDGGRTDIDRGILLCRFHHMNLHHGGWRITRSGKNDFELHPPGGKPPILLSPRAALTVAWAGIDPPPPRFRPTAA
ncbi:hypothetical protein GCM10025768_14670 [Microbacterium pseudoresistens]|uniref:HNH nuclease domain-containing protein n=1 Tax=Microbacterium pseudoresistens TaxID=640634 RepID=A0A7Y9ESZ0_9MICO|nr:HNH endonuclease signature motif containing protein [Microbacterium pseudoresistens]NYD53179.1 hypothetical protein [Microbacterium pseudoresistens]